MVILRTGHDRDIALGYDDSARRIPQADRRPTQTIADAAQTSPTVNHYTDGSNNPAMRI